MLAWSEGTDNGRQKTRNHGYDVIVGGGYSDYSISQTCHLKQNSNQQARAPASFPLVGCPTASSLAWRDFSPKVRTLWHCNRIKERGVYPMIDRGDIRQAIDHYGNIWASCRALVMVSSSIRLTAWLQNSKKRAGTVRRLMYEQVTRYLALVICIIVCLSWAVNHYHDNAKVPTKPARQKCQSWAGRRGNYWHADASAWCCCAR